MSQADVKACMDPKTAHLYEPTYTPSGLKLQPARRHPLSDENQFLTLRDGKSVPKIDQPMEAFLHIPPDGPGSELLSKEECESEWRFKEIHIISIDKARLVKCLGRLGPLVPYVKSVQGVNGKKCVAPEGFSQPIDEYNIHTKGQIGCYQSHMKAWEQVAANSNPDAEVLIIEDDADLRPVRVMVDHINKAHDEAKKWPWDIFYLGRNILLTHHRKRLSRRVVQVGKSWGLFGYVLTPKSARALLAAALPMRFPVDIFVSDTRGLCKFKFGVSPVPFLTVPCESTTTPPIEPEKEKSTKSV